MAELLRSMTLKLTLLRINSKCETNDMSCNFAISKEMKTNLAHLK